MSRERYAAFPAGITILRAKMAAILDFGHFFKFHSKTDGSTEISIPFDIYTQDFINKYAVLAELLGKI